MAQGIITDNWSLQEISTLFTEGLESSSSKEVVLANGQHSYSPVLGAIIQTEALFDFLTDLILRDEILIDEEFTSSWEIANSPILEAKKLGILRAFPFLEKPEKIIGPRERIVEHICSTQSLKDAHQKNEEGWNAKRQVPMLSSILKL